MQANTTIPNFIPAPRAEAENNVHADLYYRDDKVVAAVLWRGVEPMPFLCLQDSPDGGIATFTLVSDGDVPRFDRRQTITELNASILFSERSQPAGARIDEIVGLSLTKPGEASPRLVLAGDRPQVAPEHAAYDINDMDAAVEYSKKTQQLFREGKHAEAFAHYQQDPLGGASGILNITQERFVSKMYSMRDVQGEPLFPQPEGHALGDLVVGMKVQLDEGEKWHRVRQIIDFGPSGLHVMLDGSTELHAEDDLFETYNEPNAQQYAAVLAFSEKCGRQWKDRLRNLWMTGNYSKHAISTDQAALLQQVRNQCGPAWLENERLSRKVEPVLAVHSIELAGVTYYDMYEDMPGEHFATRQSVEHHDAPPSCSLAQAMELSIAMLNEADHGGDCYDGKFVPLTVILRDAKGRAVQEYAQHPGSKERAWLTGAPGEAEWSALEEQAKRLEERAHVESGWDNRDTSQGLGNQAMAIRRSVEIAKTLAEYGVSLADLTPQEVRYTVAVHSESWGNDAREAGEPKARDVEVESETITLNELIREAKKYGIDSVSSLTLTDPYVWFKSSSPAEGREHFETGTDKYFALHVQAVDGKEPTTEHYVDLAGKFGIKLAPRHDATADSDNAL